MLGLKLLHGENVYRLYFFTPCADCLTGSKKYTELSKKIELGLMLNLSPFHIRHLGPNMPSATWGSLY